MCLSGLALPWQDTFPESVRHRVVSVCVITYHLHLLQMDSPVLNSPWPANKATVFLGPFTVDLFYLWEKVSLLVSSSVRFCSHLSKAFRGCFTGQLLHSSALVSVAHYTSCVFFCQLVCILKAMEAHVIWADADWYTSSKSWACTSITFELNTRFNGIPLLSAGFDILIVQLKWYEALLRARDMKLNVISFVLHSCILFYLWGVEVDPISYSCCHWFQFSLKHRRFRWVWYGLEIITSSLSSENYIQQLQL